MNRPWMAALAVLAALLAGCQDVPAAPNEPRVEVSTDSPNPTRVPRGGS